MNSKNLILLITISALVAIAVVVVLKFMGHGNPTVIAGGVAGGIVGALSSSLVRNKKSVKS